MSLYNVTNKINKQIKRENYEKIKFEKKKFYNITSFDFSIKVYPFYFPYIISYSPSFHIYS